MSESTQDNKADNVLDKNKIDMPELMAILCELNKTTWFICDASTLLQRNDLFGDTDLLSQGFEGQLAEAVYKLSNKQMSLYERLESIIGEKIYFPKHESKVGLFGIPDHDKKLTECNKLEGL